MTEATAQWLLTEAGRASLQLAAALHEQRTEPAAALGRLRKAAVPELAAAAWEMAHLRVRGQAKFGADAGRMFFVREALEQASGMHAAAYHARRFVEAGVQTVADLCGGIGGDALAFARAGLHVTMFERDPVRALLAEANSRAVGLEKCVSVVSADVATVEVSEEAVWFDPARRAARGRVSDPEDYQPSLSLMTRWAEKSVGAKLAPAIDHSVATLCEAELEFLSDGGECKEGLLWTGALRSGTPLRATRLMDQEGEWSLAIDPLATVALTAPETLGILYEPDPAVIRAHGVATLAQTLDAHLVAPQIAYLLAEKSIPTPFATAYPILERFSYSRRRLQDALTRWGAGQVVIKKRGFPQEPDTIRRELKLSGTETIVVILTRAATGAGHQVFLCQRSTLAGNRDAFVQSSSP